MPVAVLSSKGQLVIPAELRRRADLEAGDRVVIDFDEASSELRLRKAETVADRIDRLVAMTSTWIKPGLEPLADPRTFYAENGTDMSLSAIDTNVALRLVVSDLPEQHRRARRLVTTPGARFLIPDQVFVELVFALERYYSLGREGIRGVVMELLSLDPSWLRLVPWLLVDFGQDGAYVVGDGLFGDDVLGACVDGGLPVPA